MGRQRMNTQRDAILGYAQELGSYYIQLFEDHRTVASCYGLRCQDTSSDQAESIMTTLILKKSYWMNGSAFQDIVKGLQPISV
jgi:hypothetical protein